MRLIGSFQTMTIQGRSCSTSSAPRGCSTSTSAGASVVDMRSADQLPERGLLADRIEVRVLLRQLATALPHVDRLAEVLDRIGRPAREALAARDVVVEVPLVWPGLDELAASVCRLRVFAGLDQSSRRVPPQLRGEAPDRVGQLDPRVT